MKIGPPHPRPQRQGQEPVQQPQGRYGAQTDRRSPTMLLLVNLDQRVTNTPGRPRRAGYKRDTRNMIRRFSGPLRQQQLLTEVHGFRLLQMEPTVQDMPQLSSIGASKLQPWLTA